MEPGRRRGQSFHEEDHLSSKEDEVEFITPAFDLNCKNEKGDNSAGLDLSLLSFDDDKTSGTATITSDEEELDIDGNASYSRGRSRSRSVHQNDNIIAPVIPVDPNSRTPRPSSSEAGSESHKSTARSGPLPSRDVLTLKKGLEEATTSRNRDQIKEEEEEKRAAESEKQLRIRVPDKVPGAVMADAPMKRIKVLVLGDSGVGKSSLILRWTCDDFNPSLVSTVGVSFKTRKVSVLNEFVQVQVWDTAGQEQFHKITTSYYKGAQGIVLVFDLSDKNSMEKIDYWVKNIKSHAQDTVRVVLLGNKSDLRSEHRVDSIQAQSFANTYRVPYFEVSAKEDTNVNEAFMTLVNEIVENDPIFACSKAKIVSPLRNTSGDAAEKGKRGSMMNMLRSGDINTIFKSSFATTNPVVTDEKTGNPKEKCIIS